MENNQVKFDTRVQWIKYKVLTELAISVWNHQTEEIYLTIPKKVIPGPKPSMRCCIYKERAIVEERIKIALGGNKLTKSSVEVIDIACDECPLGGYEVTMDCRGCLAKRCQLACKRGAIFYDEHQKAHIDKTKCINCGLCAKACTFSAIANRKRPCEVSCKVGAIKADPVTLAAHIDDEKCISCGACVYQCPFGAIQDKSMMVDVIHLLQEKKYPMIAMVAPSIVAQFKYTTLPHLISAIQKLGFTEVYEAAKGADMVAKLEAIEFEQSDVLTSSCCTAFVEYVKKNFPHLKEKISTTLSPMAILGKAIKEQDGNAKVIFIGPCTAKKKEIKDERVKPYVDAVLTFEELQALLDSKEIDSNKLPETRIQQASYFGRIFARSGGVCEAITQQVKSSTTSKEIHPILGNGIEDCKKAIIQMKINPTKYNFLEGMACVNGCLGGACNITHETKDEKAVNDFAEEAKTKEAI
jgi:[FeFe] hydrogenase (group B1/B3)